MTELTLEESLSMFAAKIAKRLDENSNLIKEIRASTDFAFRNQQASIKALKIQVRQMCIILHEKDESKESDGVKDLEAYCINAKPLGKALSRKKKDPGSFTLPCFINNICFNKALADLGASVSVMPYSTYATLGLGDLVPTQLIVELADRTVKRPKGIAKNMLVGIDKVTFLVDFVVLYMPEDIKPL
ncbi:reverse transcriptase domain-containing protein [Tanacetum coccineum]|uniref:Reverse transcriptase domain-containing protein n=1 Tax=Tanacetum coccineum TaxID=301880 RepID=A0ABQ4X9X0_9ASTR